MLDVVGDYIDEYRKKIVVLPSKYEAVKRGDKFYQFGRYGEQEIRNRVGQFLQEDTFITSDMDMVIFGEDYADTEKKLVEFEELTEERAKLNQQTIGFLPLHCAFYDGIYPCGGIHHKRTEIPNWRHRIFRFVTPFRRFGDKFHDTTYQILVDGEWKNTTPRSNYRSKEEVFECSFCFPLDLKLIHYHTLVRPTSHGYGFTKVDKEKLYKEQHPFHYLENLEEGEPEIEGPRVSLIITSHNQLKYSKITYDSLLKYTHYPYELVWVDYDSTDGTRDWLNSEIHKDTVKVFTSVGGIGAAMNIGFCACDPRSKYIGDFDNDLILTEEWLTRLIGYMENDPKLAMCAVSSSRAIGGDVYFRPKDADSLEEEVQLFAHERRKSEEKFRKRSFTNGSHTLFRRTALEEVGLWSPILWGKEDLDIGLRLTGAGWKCGYAMDIWIYHFGSGNGTGGHGKTASARMIAEKLLNKHSLWHINREKADRVLEIMYGRS